MGLKVLNGSQKEETKLTAHDLELAKLLISELTPIIKQAVREEAKDEIVNKAQLQKELGVGTDKIARWVKTPGFPKITVKGYKNPMFSLKAVREWNQKQH
jgi:hypothetical protein